MKNRRLATRYARALLDALGEPSRQEQADTFLTGLAEAMEQSRPLRDLLLDPAVPRSTRREAVARLARTQGAPPEVANLLRAVIEHNRTGDLPAIARVFHEERQRAMGIVPATITTAQPLDAPLQERTRQALEKLTGRKVELRFDVEPSLLGGAVTQIGSIVYDGSLQTQLQRLRREMTQE